MMVGIMKHKPMTFFGPPLKQPRISIKKVHPSKTNGWNLRKMETPNWKRSNIYLHKPPIIWVRSSRLFSWLKKIDLTKTRVFLVEMFTVPRQDGLPFSGWSHFWEALGGLFWKLVVGPIFGKLVVVSNIF